LGAFPGVWPGAQKIKAARVLADLSMVGVTPCRAQPALGHPRKTLCFLSLEFTFFLSPLERKSSLLKK
jgi:hypothetical protein